MNNSKVLLKVEDFRAIGKAEIKLDGITVVAGVNGCGKSTLSKLLYWVYRGATDFKVLADIQLKGDLRNINKVFFSFIQLIRNSINDENNNLEQLNNMSELIVIIADWAEIYHRKSIKEEKILDFLYNTKTKISLFGLDDICINKSFIDIIKDIYRKNQELKGEIKNLEQKNIVSSIDIINLIILYAENSIHGYQKNIVRKPRLFLDNQIKEVFHTNNPPTLLEISENELPIFKTDYEFLSEPYWIDNVIYIDTPMFFQNSGTEHWNDVNEKLKKRPEYHNDKVNTKEIDTLIKSEILTGQAEIKFNELNSSFTFITPTGAEIDLSDSATGIKAFAVLDLLLRNKSINDKTLLILDEPEAHLHPQWVIEFGRLLTLIHKYIGAKVFVATHSPDMVQALRYIPNKEGIGERVNFYLAKADDNKNGQFIYQDLKGEIDDIFSSFNISLDKLAKYGED